MKGTDNLSMENLNDNDLMATVGEIENITKAEEHTICLNGKKLYNNSFDKISLIINQDTIIKNMEGDQLSVDHLDDTSYIVAIYRYELTKNRLPFGQAKEITVINY